MNLRCRPRIPTRLVSHPLSVRGVSPMHNVHMLVHGLTIIIPKLKTRPSCTRTVITSPSSEAGIVTLMYFYHHHPLALPLASPNSISNLHSRSSSLTCAHGGCAHCAYSVSASTRGSPSTGSSVLITLNNKHFLLCQANGHS